MIDRPPRADQAGGVYVHIPFCSRRCSYCDFATVAGRDERTGAYLNALEREIDSFQKGAPGTVDTLFFGGGTPSRLRGADLRRLVQTVRNRFELSAGAEVTLESNPEDLTPDALDRFLEAGVNRLTLGVQSLNPEVLRSAGRDYGRGRAEQALRYARDAGFGQVAVDLIAGLPGEDPGAWDHTLERLAALEPDHFSVYLLETDKNTPLTRAMAKGQVPFPADDTQAFFWEVTVDRLSALGYEPYEISNFARPGSRCRHNLKYWTDAPFAGFGLGAHAYFAGERRANTRDLDGYIAALAAGRDPIAETDGWHPVRRMEEALFMGLRLVEGIDAGRLGSRYRVDILEAYRPVWEKAESSGMMAREGNRLRLTRQGMLLSNSIFAEIVGFLPLH